MPIIVGATLVQLTSGTAMAYPTTVSLTGRRNGHIGAVFLPTGSTSQYQGAKIEVYDRATAALAHTVQADVNTSVVLSQGGDISPLCVTVPKRYRSQRYEWRAAYTVNGSSTNVCCYLY